MTGKNEDNSTLILFATKIGSLEAKFKSVDDKIEKHLSAHNTDRLMQWGIIALQVVVLIFLGIQKIGG
jgi:hypothetical protein